MTIRTVSFTASRDMGPAAREGVVTSVLTVRVKSPYRGLIEEWPSVLLGEELADDPACE